MKAVLALALLGFVVAQFPNNYQHDRIHGFTFDYHSYADLIVVTNSSTCILVDVKNKEHEMRNLHSRYAIEDNIYHQIQHNEGEHRSSIQEIRQDYHDIRAVFECFRKRVLELTYKEPSS